MNSEYITIAAISYHVKVISDKVVENWEKKMALHIRQKAWWMPNAVWVFLLKLLVFQSEEIIGGFGSSRVSKSNLPAEV